MNVQRQSLANAKRQLKAKLGQSSKQIILALLSAGLLSIPYLEHQYYFLAWIAFVPLLFAVENASLKRTYILAVLAGFFTFALGTFWMQDYLILAKEQSELKSLLLASVAWLYSAQVIALCLLFYQYIRRATKLHVFIVFPLVVATIMAASPMLFAIRLGESQVNFVYALQGIEYFGLAGLDAMIALANILIYRFLCRINSESVFTIAKSKTSFVLAFATLSLWFIYGGFSYHSWDRQISNWSTLTVGLVQPNEDPTQNIGLRYPAYSQAYPPEMDMTTRLSKVDVDLVIWPEAQAKNYLNKANIQTAFAHHIKNIQTPLLFQDSQRFIHEEQLRHANIALMLDAQGEEIGRYQKIKRIPLGEYIPMAKHSPFIQSTAEYLFGTSGKNLMAGETHKQFNLDAVNIIPVICYETTFPAFVASAVNHDEMEKDKSSKTSRSDKGKLLVALSNDGWFNSLYQSKIHIFASSLRAVENRIPLIHAVNNGPSIVVLPNGKRLFTSDYQKAGGYLIDVPYSDTTSGSFYSRHPKLFIGSLYIAFVFFVLWSLKNRFVARR